VRTERVGEVFCSEGLAEGVLFSCLSSPPFYSFLSFRKCIPFVSGVWNLASVINFNPYKAEWSLYAPPGLTSKNSTVCSHSLFMCFLRISEQTTIISLYSTDLLVFITERVFTARYGLNI